MKKTIAMLLALCLLAGVMPAAPAEEFGDLTLAPAEDAGLEAVDAGEAMPGVVTEGLLADGLPEGEAGEDAPVDEAPAAPESESGKDAPVDETPAAPEGVGDGPRYARLAGDAPLYADLSDDRPAATLPGGCCLLVLGDAGGRVAVAFAAEGRAVTGYVPGENIVMLDEAGTAALVGELAAGGEVLLYEGDLDRPLPGVEADWAEENDGEEPVEETPVEETPTEEPVEDTPIEDTPIEEPVEGGDGEETTSPDTADAVPPSPEGEGLGETVEETPTEDTPTEDTPTEDTPVEDTPIEDTPVEETPTEDTPTEDTPTEDTPVEETPTEDTPTEDTPAEDIPIEETPTEENPIEEPSVGETPVADAPEGDPDPGAPSLAELADAFDSGEPAGRSDEELLAVRPETVEVSCFVSPGQDNDALFAGYASRVLYPGSRRARATMAGSAAAEALSGQELVLYEALKAAILEVAEGSLASTVFEVPVAAVLGQSRFTGDEVNALADGGLYNWDINRITQALWLDCTYELYWMDRYATPVRSTWSSWPFTGRYDESGDIVYDVEGQTITFRFPVLERYAGGDSYTVDPSLIEGARQAAENAKAIVRRYAAYSDYVKLYGYAVEICGLVSYNDAAASGGWMTENPQVQDPWKLIWVFDGDDSTNVVCEGYAQAFQYLCELTDFNGDVRCRLVTGDAGGGHAWNVVRMEDGQNYAVDVTWMDNSGGLDGFSGSLADGISGERGGLFLVGASEGSVSGGYTLLYRNGTTTSRRTYWAVTLKAYSAASLALAPQKYVLTGFQRVGGSTYFFDDEGRYVTGTRLLDGVYYDFDDAGRLQGVPSGWRTVNGRRYFFEADGQLHARHEAVAVAAVAPTCTEDGLTEGSVCAVCGEVLTEQAVVPATGHSWGEVSYSWSRGKTRVTARRVCASDPAHVESERVATSAAVTREATCAAKGQTTYTAVFENPAFPAQSKVVSDIPRLAHTPVTDAAVAPTYTRTGLTEGSHCEVCGKVLVKQKKVAKKKVPSGCVLLTKNLTRTLKAGKKLKLLLDGVAAASYKSSKTAVASVSKKGVVTAKLAGTAKITVTLEDGRKLVLKVKVTDTLAPKSVKLKQGRIVKLKVGKKLSLTAVLKPVDARTALTWTSSNPKVATVSRKGVVKARKKGRTTVTVTTANGKKASITIKVK